MFEGLSPEVAALLDASAADLPVAQADAGLLAAMAEAVSIGGSSPTPSPRKRSMLGKVLTAKAAAIAGVLVLSGGVASAATGTLPGPAQDAAASVADVVGLDIPTSDDDSDAADDSAEEKDTHGKEVSDVARDKTNDGEGNHGATVCEVASEGKCKPNADDDNSGPGNSADHRKDGEHRNSGSGGGDDDDDSTTSTTIDDVNDDDSDDDEDDDDSPASEQGKNRGKSGENKPESTDD